MVLEIRKRMRVYKDLDYIQEHLKEIIDETTIAELEMEPDYEYTRFSFWVETEEGETVEISSHGCYIKYLDTWDNIKVIGRKNKIGTLTEGHAYRFTWHDIEATVYCLESMSDYIDSYENKLLVLRPEDLKEYSSFDDLFSGRYLRPENIKDVLKVEDLGKTPVSTDLIKLKNLMEYSNLDKDVYFNTEYPIWCNGSVWYYTGFNLSEKGLRITFRTQENDTGYTDLENYLKDVATSVAMKKLQSTLNNCSIEAHITWNNNDGTL